MDCTTDSPVLKDLEPLFHEKLALGSFFSLKQNLYIAVSLWHMENKAEFKVIRSDASRVEYKCRRSDGCAFFMRANCRAGLWFVHKLTLEHNCNLDFANLGPRSVRSLAVAAYFARKMRRQGSIIKPKDIMIELLQSFGIQASYSVALRARNTAISLIYGGQADSFQMLPKYLEVLRKFNPGTMTDLDIGPDDRFRHCFLALGVCRIAFTTCLRPVVVVDATHLKGRNKGVLFVAASKDGNEQVVPLAIAIGPIENDESWTWFLARLRQAFGCPDHLLIVSDQHKSIANAVKNVYPDTTHAICYYHLQNKLTSYGAAIVNLYHRAAYAYRDAVYKKTMEQIAKHNSGAFDKLMSANPEQWARSQCPVRRYSFMTSNAAEVFNSRLLDARRLPVCSMMEAYRHIVEEWFDTRRIQYSVREHALTEQAVAKIAPAIELSQTYTVVKISEQKFKVNDGNRTWTVHLGNSQCNCREFDLDLIPCFHAVAAIRFERVNFYDYVRYFYKTSTLRSIYAGTVNPLPPQNEWKVSSENNALTVLPQIITRQAGRPKNSHRVSGAEASSSRNRAPKTCSICRSTRHTKNKCLERAQN